MPVQHKMHGYAHPVVEVFSTSGHHICMQEVKRIRQQRKLSQTALAEMVGVNQATISKIENGDTGVTLGLIQRIAKALDVSPVSLFGLPEFQRNVLEAMDRMDDESRQAATLVLQSMANRSD